MYLTGGISAGNSNSSPLQAYVISSSEFEPAGHPEGFMLSQSASLVHPSQLPSEDGKSERPHTSHSLIAPAR